MCTFTAAGPWHDATCTPPASIGSGHDALELELDHNEKCLIIIIIIVVVVILIIKCIYKCYFFGIIHLFVHCVMVNLIKI